MGKKKKARGTVPVVQKARGQAFEFDYEKLAEAIVHAQVEAEVLHEKSKEKLAEEQQREWLKTLGQKTYSKENCITRILHRWRNNIVMSFKILTIDREKVQGDRAIFGLLQVVLGLLFGAFKLFWYLLTIVLIVASIYFCLEKTYILSFTLFLDAIFVFMMSGVFRIAGFEIEKMKDRNYLLSILSAVTALTAMILALVALFVR